MLPRITPEAILAHLNAKTPLPNTGIVAGQSVASAIIELMQHSVLRPVFNDIDVFVDAQGNTDGRIPFGETKDIRVESYQGIVWAANGDRYSVVSSEKYGLLNTITVCTYGCRSTPASIIAGFDLNCVQVAIDLATKELVATQAFWDFLDSCDITIERSHTVTSTLLRAMRKSKELNARFDVEKEAALVALALHICPNEAPEKYMHQAHFYEEALNAFVRFDVCQERNVVKAYPSFVFENIVHWSLDIANMLPKEHRLALLRLFWCENITSSAMAFGELLQRLHKPKHHELRFYLALHASRLGDRFVTSSENVNLDEFIARVDSVCTLYEVNRHEFSFVTAYLRHETPRTAEDTCQTLQRLCGEILSDRRTSVAAALASVDTCDWVPSPATAEQHVSELISTWTSLPLIHGIALRLPRQWKARFYRNTNEYQLEALRRLEHFTPHRELGATLSYFSDLPMIFSLEYKREVAFVGILASQGTLEFRLLESSDRLSRRSTAITNALHTALHTQLMLRLKLKMTANAIRLFVSNPCKHTFSYFRKNDPIDGAEIPF